MSAEDPSSPRTARVSPSHQRNGHDDRVGSVSRTDETRGSTRRTRPEQLNTGPAPLAAGGSSSPVPYPEYSDADSEYNVSQEQARRLNHSYGEQVALRHGSGSGRFIGAQQVQQEHFAGGMWPFSKHSLSMSHELDELAQQSCQMVEQSHTVSGPHVGSRSATPAMDSFRQSGALSYAEQNGYCPTPAHFDDSRYSSIPSRSARMQKPPRIRHHPDTDPNLGTSSAGQQPLPVLSRAERMAALERRMVANGLLVPHRSRASLGQKRKGQGGVANAGAVQMSDSCTTSGSESSESEAETNRGHCSSPLTPGNPAEVSSASPIPRNKFSFGSLQLDEEPDEDGCHVFSDEDGTQIFSC